MRPMVYVLTLIAHPDDASLEPAIVAEARHALNDLGASTGEPVWLAPDIACDIPFARLLPDRAEGAVGRTLEGWPIDIVAQRAEGRKKKLLIADMDSTIVTGETLDELAEFAGVKEQVAHITERAMRGELDFSAALDARVALLAGLPAVSLAQAYERTKLTSGARALVTTMRAGGAYAALLSGGFDFFTTRVRDAVGFDLERSNRLEIVDGKLTGRVVPPVFTRDGKLETLLRLATERRLGIDETMAVGDGANDIPMLLAAGAGVAFHAKPAVAATARIKVQHGDLTALLYVQGYRAEEFRQ